MRYLLHLIILFFITSTVTAQNKQENVKSGLKTIAKTFASTYFPNEKRNITIALPNPYDSSKKYPVIYVLDGSSLFGLVTDYVKQLSKLTIEDTYDYATDAIPSCIVVGIHHNDRYYETSPNFSKIKGVDETHYLEGPALLKKFIFRELVPFINKEYNTSGYNTIIGHSNTAHFVMCLPFQKNNPFRGIIAISVSGDSPSFKEKCTHYLANCTQENIFLGYGTKDFGFNEFAKSIEQTVVKENVTIKSYPANHNEMPALSLVDALKSLFKQYRNIDDFKKQSHQADFNISNYLARYTQKNRQLYGIDTKMKEVDFYSLLEISMADKNKPIFQQILTYDKEKNGNTVQTHLLFVYNKQVGNTEKALLLANKMMKSQDKFEKRVFTANLNIYYDFFIHTIHKPKAAIRFFKEGAKKHKKKSLELNYFLAKVALTDKASRKQAIKSLIYCKKRYKENKYFTLPEIEQLIKNLI